MRMILKNNHPLIQKLDKLLAYADELGIQIDYSWNNSVVTYQGKDYKLLDIDNNEPVSIFPPQLEYKLIYEKEEPGVENEKTE